MSSPMPTPTPTPLQKHSQQLPIEASKADSTCQPIGNPVGGTGGGEFADPCDKNTKIDEIEIGINGFGGFDGISDCLEYIKTTYRYEV